MFPFYRWANRDLRRVQGLVAGHTVRAGLPGSTHTCWRVEQVAADGTAGGAVCACVCMHGYAACACVHGSARAPPSNVCVHACRCMGWVGLGERKSHCGWRCCWNKYWDQVWGTEDTVWSLPIILQGLWRHGDNFKWESVWSGVCFGKLTLRAVWRVDLGVSSERGS